MNQRIRELALQAGHKPLGTFADELMDIYNKKFALLIVRECADVAKETRWAVPPSQEQIARAIQQHFGVEE